MQEINPTATEADLKRQDTENGTVFYDLKDVARMLKCSIPTAREIMHRYDFPLIQAGGKRMLVFKNAFEQWAMVKRI